MITNDLSATKLKLYHKLVKSSRTNNFLLTLQNNVSCLQTVKSIVKYNYNEKYYDKSLPSRLFDRHLH